VSEASIIMSQISKGVLMSIGCRSVSAIDKGVQFVVGPTTRRVVKIVVNPLDLYDISVQSMRTDLSWDMEYEVSNIFADQLNDLLLFIERRVWGGEV
jgi:hypothetical protein